MTDPELMGFIRDSLGRLEDKVDGLAARLSRIERAEARRQALGDDRRARSTRRKDLVLLITGMGSAAALTLSALHF